MDFLVNFDNNTDKQVPSKLIDYALTDRPILNIEKVPNREMILEFLGGNYRHTYPVRDLERYNIKKVAVKFLELVD